MKKLKIKWFSYAFFGLILTGSGLGVIGEAIIRKFSKAEFNEWFYLGLLGLVLFHSGLSFFAQATVFRVILNQNQNS